MDIDIYNTSLERVKILDLFDSLLWNVKYRGYGDFTLNVPYDKELIKFIKKDYYLRIPESDRAMIIERAVKKLDEDKGLMASISGRSLEVLCTRRIVWRQTTLKGDFQTEIHRLLDENIINPEDPDRQIPNFIFKESTDPIIAAIVLDEHQYTGQYIYDIINSLCALYNLGWKVTINDNNQFVFELFSGVDRTSEQITNPILEFSSDNDNLLSAESDEDSTNYKNVTLIAGEGEGLDRKTATYGEASGINRREYFTDARDISSTTYDENTGNETTISDAEYEKLLIARGEEKLNKYKLKTEFDSEVDSSEDSMYQYGVDYFLGDTVDVVDFIGEVHHSRITEVTIILNDTEYSIRPVFSKDDEEESLEEA